MAHCQYLVCENRAEGRCVINALDELDRVKRATVAVCKAHFQAITVWIDEEHRRPHILMNGDFYVGELDELVQKGR